MRLKKTGRRTALKSKKRSSKLLFHRRTHLERLENRVLLAAHAHELIASGVGYYPPQYRQGSTDGFLTGPSTASPLDAALTYARDNSADFGLISADLDLNNIVVTDQYTSGSGVTHIYLSQMLNNLDIANAVMNINVADDGSIVSAGGSFLPLSSTPIIGTEPLIPATSAYANFAAAYELPLEEVPTILVSEDTPNQQTVISAAGLAQRDVVAELQYVPTESGLELSWSMDVGLLQYDAWADVFVSAVDGDLLNYDNRVAFASYEVFEAPLRSPDDGNRTIVVNPQDPIASPLGWHDGNGLPGADFFETRGNNIIAQEDRDGIGSGALAVVPVARPQGGAGLNFTAPLDLNGDPSFYTDASTINLFYLTNYAHDVAFRYGFDEPAGNFQLVNYSGTGQAGDPVVAFAQAEANAPTLNNAQFVPFPEGQQSFIRMFEWDTDTSDLANPVQYGPRRDGSFAADIVIHEYAHGITLRLTGGPANIASLNMLQPAAVGEGWSDYFALAFLQDAGDTKMGAIPLGQYVNGPNPQDPSAGAARRFPFSFDKTINPLTYANFNPATTNVPQNGGEIWASALWDMHWLLIDKYGFDPNIHSGTGGNNLAIQLVMDGLKLQPAEPSFIDARNAILNADLILNKGVNHKEIWQAFARRGLGLSAVADTTNVIPDPNSDMVREAFDTPSTVSTVSGRVFSDLDADGTRSSDEPGLANRQVFIDLNNSGVRDPLEPATLTDGGGNYTFEFLVEGAFTIAQTVGADMEQTAPANGGGQQVIVAAGRIISDVDFGLLGTGGGGGTPGGPTGALQTLIGTKFNDLNGDGRHEECPIIPGTIQPECDREPGVPGVWIFADIDNDTRLDSGEPVAITGPNGEYRLPINEAATFFLREVMTPGWTQTFPGGTAQGHRVTVSNRPITTEFDFGNQSTLDYGDAPGRYPTTVSRGGPVAPILEGFHLGATVDSDLNGLPTDGADGDDNDQATNDEDGVIFNSTIAPGGTGTIDIVVASGAYSPGRVNAWIDFSGDGDWSDAGEHVVVDSRMGTGSKTFSFSVPSSAVAGLTFARVTYGYHRYKAGESPTARDIAGEIEDHVVRVLSNQPEAIDDQFRLDQNSSANVLAVLDNDVSSQNGPIFIASTSVPNRGGRVSISASGLTLSYTPTIGFAGVETFTYTIFDQAGASSTATVTNTVVPDTPALALDDSFNVSENSSNNVLNVTQNDLAGQNPPIQILDIVPSTNSTVVVDRGGSPAPEDDVLLYTPNAGFGGTDQFSYIIADAAGIQSSATVTVHVQPGSLADDIIEFELVATNLTGNPISAIGVGQPFILDVYVQDLRIDDGDGNPIDRRGIAAGYLDVLYDLSLVSVAGNITFGSRYLNATSGDTSVPGIVNEAGGLQTNSIPLGAERQLLLSIPMIGNSAGFASFTGDPADERAEVNPNTPDHDSLTFQPPANISLQNMRFTDTAISIVSSGSMPSAVDNTFSVAANNAVSNTLDVLDNDSANGSPPLSVVTVTQGVNGGQVLIATGGGSVLYRPAAGFSGVDQFTYTAQNSTGLSASATVTVQVGDNTKSLNYRLETVPSGTVAVGANFEVRGYIQDLRPSDGDANPRDDRGVFAAYMDLLFDSDLVSVVSDLTNPLIFAPAYQNGISGSQGTANLVDEIGAFQSGSRPLGPGEQLLFTIQVQANAPGVAEFQTDPADISPLHDSLLFEPTTPLPLNAIGFGGASVTIVSAAPEGEGRTNPSNPLDVNNDGYVTSIDPLVVVNFLNRSDSEGEATSMFVDVTGDGYVSPVDVLELINFINRNGSSVGAESEGEGEGLFIPLDASASATTVPSGSSQQRSIDLLVTSGPLDAQRVDRQAKVLADWNRDSSESDSDSFDDLVTEELARDILGGWSE